jgi:outer membrane receptor for ferrienterochelin and colicin
MLLAIALVAVPVHASTDLTVLSLEQLMRLTVVGASKYEQDQSEVAAAVSVITRDEIRAFGWRTIDEALASLPGIYITYDRQYTHFGTRGFSLPGDFNTRILVMINGNRVNDVNYDNGPMGRQFPLDMGLVERIEFIPGPGGAVYGQNAMFGVINVITRRGADIGGVELAAAAQRPQSLREGRASWGALLENGVDMALSVSGMHARGEDRFFDFGATGASGVARGLDGDHEKTLFARIGRGPWAFDLVYGDHRKDDPTGAYLSDPLVPGQYQGNRYTLAQWQYQDSFRGDTLQLLGRLFVGQDRYSAALSYGTWFGYPAVSDWRGGELRLLSTALAGHKLMLGLEAQRNVRADQLAQDMAHPANDTVIHAGGHRAGLYMQDEWRIADALAATLGLRIDHNNQTGAHTSPRGALIWHIAPATTLKALYGRAHRAPNAFERDYFDGVQVANPALRGESIGTLELVADHNVGADLHLRGTAYQWNMRDLIVLGIDPVSGFTQYQSGNTLKAKGVGLSLDKTWTWGGRLRGSVSLQHLHDANDAEANNSPHRLGKLNFSAPLPLAGLRLGYELQYDSRRKSLNGDDLGGYALSNLQLRADTWVKRLELGLGIRNLFDKRYAHPGADNNWQNALDQDGRSARLEALYRF